LPPRATQFPTKETAIPFIVRRPAKRALLGLVEADRLRLPEAEVASLGAPLLFALRAAGIVRDEDPRMVDLSPADPGRALRKRDRVLSRGRLLPSSLNRRPVLKGRTGEGATLRETVLVAHPKQGVAFALLRSQRSLVLVPTSHALRHALASCRSPRPIALPLPRMQVNSISVLYLAACFAQALLEFPWSRP